MTNPNRTIEQEVFLKLLPLALVIVYLTPGNKLKKILRG